MEDFDDWGLSAEDLDFLEKDAINKLSQKKTSPAIAPCSSSPLVPPQPAINKIPTSRNFEQFPSSTTSVDSCHARVEGSPSRLHVSGENDNNSAVDLQKVSVRLYLHASGAIAAKFPYHTLLVEAFHKIPKASWHGKERVWMFPISSLATAEEVLNQVTGVVVEVQKLDPLVYRALTAATAVPDLRALYDKMPSYIESKLLPFQREGVRFVLQHGGRVLLADEMGLGKTLQAIAFTACVHESWPVLVITPSSLRLHWASMIQQWLNVPAEDILILLSSTGAASRGGFTILRSNVKADISFSGIFNIVSYDAMLKFQNIIMASEFKIVIADESHFLKNAQAKRTSATLPVIQKAQYAVLLSGTPALSRPIELYKQLEALSPDVYKNVHDYGNRYCKGGVFGLYQGASNHEELHSLMKTTVMIRRLKKDVLTELPVKRRQQVFLELSEKDTKQIRALFRELEFVKNSMKASESREELESLKLSQKHLINKIYTDSAEAKVPAVLDYLGTVIEADCKFLVFAHHQPMIDAIHAFLRKKKVGCIRIDGHTASSSRQALVNDFQENDGIKAAVLSIKAAGVGLTLTAASTVIFAELTWTPGDIIQAEDRAHRIGQVSSVNVYYLLAYDTADDIMWDVLQSKLDNVGQVLDGEQKELEVTLNLTGSSPAKHKSTPKNQMLSPGKQKTLDAFVKRCSTAPDTSPKSQRLKF
ncbi:uncharacterized protein A4U43_C07F11710 [Asparagus officinalis]|uniref:SWI/SNF-related matrix-associated actin-dependent regulator of chromatin subfamily A-like protein 1 n=1 Tax=Asparagus officinalis TaxID=4686 RepID=A0A5P1EE84_ASPOF|nr:SWI/SNF-related matrix-associated actin-dependent regulator of chromatin subfamily A-like protein 1 [Asparagus officinalis]ONK63129.1 uncharacterized protein A4U43_C07F11710 [Asparagus officinalis]